MASPPQTPPNRDPEDEADFRFKTNGTPCEWGESYRPVGYHPVVLGDVLHNRYRIIRKLGYGSFSTAWLAVDLHLNSFAAVKVSVASPAHDQATATTLAIYRSLPPTSTTHRHIVALRDTFDILGPNGKHTCLVMDPAGPHLPSLLTHRRGFDGDQSVEPWHRRPRFPHPLARRILRDTLRALGVLHQRGIVHGDLHPGNILAAIPPLLSYDAELERSWGRARTRARRW
jgi:non-specific serine/threonine protein kinase